MRIVSWNVNGIRSLKKDIGTIIQELGADIACFQETKITKELMTEKLALVDGYRSYFSYSKTRAGYSGVATYCRRSIQPHAASDSLVSTLEGESELKFSLPNEKLKSLDAEGRTVITQHKLMEPVHGKDTLTVVNLYCPCVTGETDGRELFRLEFLQTLEERIKQLRVKSHVIVLGDINISHKVIDSCDPGEHEEFLSQPHRLWLNRILGTSDEEEGMMIDTYRTLNPDKKFAYTCWNTKINARQTNFGTRIDYVLLDKNLDKQLDSAEVHAKYLGSDHCPVSADIAVCIKPALTVPTLCSSVRYKAKQQKLTMFIKKGSDAPKKDIFDTVSKPTVTSSKLSYANSKSALSSTTSSKPALTSCSKKRKKTNTLNGFVKQAKMSDSQGSSGEENLSQKSSQTTQDNETRLSQGSEKESSQPDNTTETKNNDKGAAFMKLFSRGKKSSTPVCSWHKEKAVLQTVRKEGENKGRKFYACSRGVGAPGNSEARCSYFKWADEL